MAYYGQGDPGFWGALGGAITGYMTGGWGGAVAGAVSGWSGHPSSGGGSPMPGGAGGVFGPVRSEAAGYAVGQAARTVMGHPVLSAAGAAGTIGVGYGAYRLTHGHPVLSAAGASVLPRGYHVIKRGPRAGQPTRNRRMNVCNPRALRRSLRRAHGFTKLAMRTIHLVHPKKRARFGGWRRRSRK